MTKPTLTPIRLLLIALAGATLACSLTWGEQQAAPAGGSNTTTGPAPAISIREPVQGQQVAVNQRVDVLIDSSSTTTSFQMNAGGKVASTVAMPPGQSGPASVILTWLPERLGTYTLEIYAFNGAAISEPATLSLQVVAGGTAGQPSGATVCTGRVMVSQLNFRDGPSTGASRLGQFDTGETVTVIGRNADTSWYQVQRFNMQQAWAINNATWFQVEGPCSTLPVTG